MAEYLGYAFVDAAECVFFGFDGQLDREKTDRSIAAALSEHGRIVIPGFYGRLPTGKIKVMSRGGSDITGALAAAAAGAEYYCMDAGWYANGTWWETVGEWLPYEGRFPNGIKRVFDYVREKGMIPGIWLEIEVMGIGCPLAKEWEDACFFLRHGKRVIDHGRYQLDFRHPKVRAHATAVVDRVVREYGVGYIKMDYNIEAGLGTEVDADSFGDGLLAHQRAYLAWLEETLAQYPDLVWENYSSGGMRMDYAMLRRAHLQSVTDQTDYKKMVHIAAAAPMAALPEQAAIWSYPLADADADAVVVNMINAMLQRIHLSGKMTALSPKAFALVQEGVAVYKQYRACLQSALPRWPLGYPMQGKGFEALEMVCANRVLIAVWRLDADADAVVVPVAVTGVARVLYPSDSDATVQYENGSLGVTLPRKNMAVLIEIR
jgi:alpha-galactosidase